MEAIRLMKTPGSSENSEEIEHLLSCPICLEVYSKPVVILPCQHNLCRKCAHDMFQSRGTPMGSGGRFKCPTCRYEVILDRHGVYGLQRNLLVENIVDMYQSSQNLKPTIEHKPAEEVIKCSEHPDENISIYCVTCQKPTCSLCKIFGSHSNCEVATFQDMHSTLKLELSDTIDKLVTTNDQLHAAVIQTDDITQVTEMNGNSVKTKINKAFDDLSKILENRRQIMLSIVSKELKKKKEYSEKVKTKLTNQQSLSGDIMEGALNLLEEKKSAVFLEQARDIIEKIEDNLEVNYDSEICMELKDMSKFDFDFNEEEELLKATTFLALKEDTETPSTSSAVRDQTIRPWEVENDSEETSEEEEEEDDEEDEEIEIKTANEQSSTSESDSEESIPYTTAPASRRVTFPWQSRNNYDLHRTPSPESSVSRSRAADEKNEKKVYWFDTNQSNTETTTNKPNVRVKIDPPKPFTWTRPSYKPKKPVRFANLLPLSDSDDDLDNYSSSRRARLARVSKYGDDRGGSSMLAVPQTSEDSSRSLVDSITDPNVSVKNETGSSSSSVVLDPSQDTAAERRRKSREYCTHKRRTWSHLLEKKP